MGWYWVFIRVKWFECSLLLLSKINVAANVSLQRSRRSKIKCHASISFNNWPLACEGMVRPETFTMESSWHGNTFYVTGILWEEEIYWSSLDAFIMWSFVIAFHVTHEKVVSIMVMISTMKTKNKVALKIDADAIIHHHIISCCHVETRVSIQCCFVKWYTDWGIQTHTHNLRKCNAHMGESDRDIIHDYTRLSL